MRIPEDAYRGTRQSPCCDTRIEVATWWNGLKHVTCAADWHTLNLIHHCPQCGEQLRFGTKDDRQPC